MSLFFVACAPSNPPSANEIIEKSIAAYGWNQREFKMIFDFRAYQYELVRQPDFYSYQRTTTKEGVTLRDVMTSEIKLERFKDNLPVSLQDSLVKVYSNSLNSVMYFFQLPRPLKDPAVRSVFLGTTFFSEKPYWTLKVRFNEVGGGEDFQDEYRYWIDPESGHIDYLAYNYHTDGGGTRFRKAKNRRKKEGFVFQDYINYKTEKKFTSLDSLPLFFKMGKLIEVSQIENENIQVFLPKQ